jgi:hypothetical protein
MINDLSITRKAVQAALPEESAPVRIAVSPRNKAVPSMVGIADLYVYRAN